MCPALLVTPPSFRRLTYAIITASAVAFVPFLVWPGLIKGLFTSDFLPHLLLLPEESWFGLHPCRS